MKKITLLLLAVFLVTSVISCKKSKKKNTSAYTCSTCATTPEALAANDASSKGIYIGVFIGSTGTIKFDLANNGTTFTAVMVIDGVTVNLTSAVVWVNGESYVAPFTGTYNGDPITVNFSVGATGESAEVTSSNIPGHPNAGFIIAKETSTALIEAFEGTYHTTAPEDGTFNVVLSKALNRWGVVSRKNGITEEIHHGDDGTLSGNDLIDSDNKKVATISGDELNGSFVDGNNSTVTVTGKRTL